MAAQSYDVDLKGYYREYGIDSIPSKSGIYCVYECNYDSGMDKFSFKKLLYIGESEDLNSRVKNHEKLNDWKKLVHSSNELCFSYGEVDSTYRKRVEAALIIKHKPPANSEYTNAFQFDSTTINLTGRAVLLATRFTI